MPLFSFRPNNLDLRFQEVMTEPDPGSDEQPELVTVTYIRFIESPGSVAEIGPFDTAGLELLGRILADPEAARAEAEEAARAEAERQAAAAKIVVAGTPPKGNLGPNGFPR